MSSDGGVVNVIIGLFVVGATAFSAMRRASKRIAERRQTAQPVFAPVSAPPPTMGGALPPLIGQVPVPRPEQTRAPRAGAALPALRPANAAPPPPPAATPTRRTLALAFGDPAHAREAVILADILGPPVALR